MSLAAKPENETDYWSSSIVKHIPKSPCRDYPEHRLHSLRWSADSFKEIKTKSCNKRSSTMYILQQSQVTVTTTTWNTFSSACPGPGCGTSSSLCCWNEMETYRPTVGLNSIISSSVGSKLSSFLNRTSGNGKCMIHWLYKAKPHSSPNRKKFLLLSSVACINKSSLWFYYR